ncbi:MAG TPA: hypothetical protein VKA15_04055 [Isosphaeraceae bacterium]|nr:hypothetical protein [Isosphaeraceae bacterium]
MNLTARRGLVPPRPNLGPEPWSETQSMRAVYVALALGVILASAALYGVWRHRRIARGKAKKRPAAERQGATASERLIGLSGSLRAALTDRFGTSYRARTTEELSADLELGQLLGGESFEQLIQFLDQIDRIKFAPVRTPNRQHALEQDLAEWEPRVRDLVTQIREKPSAAADPKQIRRPRVIAGRRRPESERR